MDMSDNDLETGAVRIGPAARIMAASIRGYRKYISPMKSTRCPYIPTCSAYGLEAVERYGAVKGAALAAWRVLRCNPLSSGGYDPVP